MCQMTQIKHSRCKIILICLFLAVSSNILGQLEAKKCIEELNSNKRLRRQIKKTLGKKALDFKISYDPAPVKNYLIFSDEVPSDSIYWFKYKVGEKDLIGIGVDTLSQDESGGFAVYFSPIIDNFALIEIIRTNSSLTYPKGEDFSRTGYLILFRFSEGEIVKCTGATIHHDW